MTYTDAFFCVLTAWIIVFLYEHLYLKVSFANGAIAGIVCTSFSVLLHYFHITVDLIPITFFIISSALPIQSTGHRRDYLFSYFLSTSSYALLAFISIALHCYLSNYAATVFLCLICLSIVAITILLRKYFPPDDWRKYFEERSPENANIHKEYVYIAYGVLTAVELSLLYTVPVPTRKSSAVFVILAYLCLYFCVIYMTCIMIVNRRERLTTLIEQDYRAEMQAYMSVIRSQRHDYNFHVQTLSALINDGNLEDCRQYVSNLVIDSVAMNAILPIKDPAIAALIFSFRTIAMKSGIELHFDIQNDLSHIVTNVYETNKIIGNLLQNAVDEVKMHRDKSFGIYLYIIKRGDCAIIHVANKLTPQNTNNYLEKIYNPGCTTKLGHDGIGLNSIQNILAPYHGIVYSKIDDSNIIHFIAKIPLRIGG